jgi:hypothetical protein
MNDPNLNPYAAPVASLVPEYAGDNGVWRDADLLVVRKGSSLPDRCIKCNAQAGGLRKQLTLYWHSPWLYTLVILQLLIYIVVSLIVRQKIVLPTGICRRHLARRRWAIFLAWLLFFGGLGATILGGCLMDNRQRQAFGLTVLWGGAIVMVGGVIYGVVASRLLWAKRIDPYFAWLKGACPEYLAELPDVPPPGSPTLPPR